MTLITTPYWWEGGSPLPTFSTRPPAKVELAVIGGGFTGMSAGLTAAQKGAQVALFDSGIPGQGASTRNGGMIGAPHRPGFVTELKTYGEELAHALTREGIEGYEFTKSLYTAGDIDAGFQQTGRIQLANTKPHFENMKMRAKLLNSVQQQGIQVIERDAIPQHINSDIYFGGLFYPDHGGLHPRMAHDGLMGKAMSAGVAVHANCPVTNLEKNADGFLLTTPLGKTQAIRLVMATNGYTTPSPTRWLARRIFRIPSFLIATEELPREVIDRVAPGRHMMVESRARHSYFRPSADGKRILFGGRAALVPIDEELAAKRLHETVISIWPEAVSWKISHCWRGFTGFTFAMIPHVGEHEGMHFAMGYCGNGVALSPWLGRKAALRALGDAEGETAYAQTRLEARPYHIGGNPWFMGIASPWWRFIVDTMDRRQAARDRREI